MSIHAGPFATRREARKASQAVCRREARRRGVAYPIPHTEVVGIAPADLYTHPERYGTRHLTDTRKRKGRAEHYFELTARMREVPEGATERVDGEDVPVRRDGVELGDSEFEREADE